MMYKIKYVQKNVMHKLNFKMNKIKNVFKFVKMKMKYYHKKEIV